MPCNDRNIQTLQVLGGDHGFILWRWPLNIQKPVNIWFSTSGCILFVFTSVSKITICTSLSLQAPSVEISWLHPVLLCSALVLRSANLFCSTWTRVQAFRFFQGWLPVIRCILVGAECARVGDGGREVLEILLATWLSMSNHVHVKFPGALAERYFSGHLLVSSIGSCNDVCGCCNIALAQGFAN